MTTNRSWLTCYLIQSTWIEQLVFTDRQHVSDPFSFLLFRFINHPILAALYDATCTWSGVLPPRTSKPSGYSSKVFLGGVPWDISEQLLIQTFKQFGPIRVEWPGKEKQASQPKGYVYIIFESEKNVRALLQACTNDHANSGNWYFKISSKRMKAKEVSLLRIQYISLLRICWACNGIGFICIKTFELRENFVILLK